MENGNLHGRLAVLGTGRMGEALVSGLLRTGWASTDQLRCTTRTERRAKDLYQRFGVQAGTDSVEAISGASGIILAVKPQNLRELCAEIAPRVEPEQTVISVAAGVPTHVIEELLPGQVPVVRVMSNVPVQVDAAMSAVAPGRHAGNDHVKFAKAILGHVGHVIELGEEHLDAVTALSGSGPAYLFLLAESMIEAGILLGLSREVATDLVTQTMYGAAKMLRETGRHPVELRESVTSPGGTTTAAVRVLEEERVRAAFLNAIEAAKNRSQELAEG